MAVEKKFVREAVGRLLIREYLRRETERAGFGGIDIQRTPMGTRVSIIAERPGMVIGRKGVTINALTDELNRRFRVENPQIEVIEAGHEANLNAQIMAQKIAEALERGWHFRRAGHSTVQRVMGSGAQGCQVIVSGKLTGQRHRTEKFSQGHIKYCGETADRVMDVGFAVAKKKLGVIGCTVRIMRAEWKLPDNITIHAPDAAAPVPTSAVPEPKAAPVAEAPSKKKTAKDDAADPPPKKKAPAKKRAPAKKKAATKDEAEAGEPAPTTSQDEPAKAPAPEPAAAKADKAAQAPKTSKDEPAKAPAPEPADAKADDAAQAPKTEPASTRQETPAESSPPKKEDEADAEATVPAAEPPADEADADGKAGDPATEKKKEAEA